MENASKDLNKYLQKVDIQIINIKMFSVSPEKYKLKPPWDTITYLIKGPKFKRLTISSIVKDVKNWNSHTLLLGM